ncbi:MAG: class I SAM-dependent methyltransferase [Anaerolineaceae bacterium]|nr:class I SAM-dependent methyltransferase [Anaerolineaceae bacterium]
MIGNYSDKAALRGEPSYVWRAGQDRRLSMITAAAGDRVKGVVFENGLGLGAYLARLASDAKQAIGLDVELERTIHAHKNIEQVVCGVGEKLPFPDDYFDLVLSNEVIEHVNNDYQVIKEMVRTLKPTGRIVLFCPNRGYPFETHGIYWRGKYKFGNIPLVNYLPRKLRDKLAPHVQIYTRKDLKKRFDGLPVKFIKQATVFGAYDNVIARSPGFGKFLRSFLQQLEKTPFQRFGLSHFWVIEKTN